MTNQPSRSVRQDNDASGALHARMLEQEIDTASAFEELFASEQYAFWLDSGLGTSGRYSLLGAATEVVRGGFDRLERAMQAATVQLPPELPAELACGWVGFFGYEPETSQWMVPDRFLVVDHQQHRSWVVGHDPTWPGRVAESLPMAPTGSDEGSPTDAREDDSGSAAGLCELTDSTATSDGTASTDPAGEALSGPRPEPWLVRGRERYLADIEICLDHLRAGDSYEICLTNTVALPYPSDAEDPVRTFRRLRRLNPAPYAALLKFDRRYVLSASPERFLTVDRDGTAESRPIKGTAARSSDPDEDLARAKGLATDEKTRAENLMIVDLVRNDLGRVCRPGSIEVPSFLAVESYATVHQLVSTIRGRLDAEQNAVRAAEACFPPGSMTGAPKQRTMQIIDELEQRPRGVYSGALGWFGLAGNADLAVVIRTAEIDRDRETVTVGAGGAIVLDSDPEQEYAEMLVKASVPLRALRRSSSASPG